MAKTVKQICIVKGLYLYSLGKQVVDWGVLYKSNFSESGLIAEAAEDVAKYPPLPPDSVVRSLIENKY